MGAFDGHGFSGQTILKAKKVSWCAKCPLEIEIENQIVYWEGSWVHIGCHPRWEYSKVQVDAPEEMKDRCCAFCGKHIGLKYKGEMTEWGRVHWKCFSTWKQDGKFSARGVKKYSSSTASVSQSSGPKLWECQECSTKIPKPGLCKECNLAQYQK